jgi:hypothetical protein
VSGTRDIIERELVAWGFRRRREDRMRRAAIRRQLLLGPFMAGFEHGLGAEDQDRIRGHLWPSIRATSRAVSVPPAANNFDTVVL